MQHKKQVVYWLTIFAMLLATVGIFPAAASILSSSATTRATSETGSDDTVLPPTEKMIAEREAAIAACENDPNPEECEAEVKGEQEGSPLLRDEWFYDRRTAGDPSVRFTMADAATLRAQAAEQAGTMMAQQAHAPVVPNAFGGPWTAVGPNPMVLTGRGDASFDAMTGRIGALAVRSTAPYTIYLGGAQGGVWESAWVTQTTSNQWTAKTDQLSSLAIGAIALAPSNEDVVYVGTGEGALSGDSYFGNGVLKSTNAGATFAKISAAGYFTNVSISKIVVDNNNPNTLYAGTLRGRGGARRTSPPDAAPFGVWKSTDGGINWTMVYTVGGSVLSLAGVTDLAMDPQNSQIIYAADLGVGIFKTTNGGATWAPIMNGFPANADFSVAPTRFALGIGHPTTTVSATLYAGFEWFDNTDVYHHSTVWKSTNEGASWSETNTAVVGGYCNQSPTSPNSQCFYDNVLEVDPSNANIVFAIGLYNYDTGSGGVYRSMDGGANWVDIGFNLHPDYHAIAIRKDDPANVVIGNDGGAWLSTSRGGRLLPSDPLDATTWINLNGLVDPSSATVLARTGLQLGQFESIATNPAVANRFYGGFQDNGTQRKSTGSSTWFDVASGDGGQVLVDPTDANYVYQTYYGLSPNRYVDGGGLYGGGYTSNEPIRNGLHNDRVEFYLPWIIDPGNSNRLYLGTYRVYRTDNAKADKSGDVLWQTISGDLTSGCTGSAPNGGRGCTISALAASAESPAVYAGTEEGWLWLSTNSTSDTPTWNRIDISGTTPMRPVASIAADRSNYRVAVVGFNGFSAATPSTPGHVFKTANGGASWTRIDLVGSGFPDVPVNTVLIDPSDPNTIYAGTDVGPFVTNNGGTSWSALGSGFPIVAIQQMTLNPYTRQLVAATHGRGAWSLTNASATLPALQIGKTDGGIPIGPGSSLTYQITVKNYGNVQATNVVIADPLPANTTFVAAGSGGTFNGTNVVFTVTQVPTPTAYNTGGSLGVGLAPGSATVTYTVMIGSGLNSGDVITNDGYSAASMEGASAVGSPHYVTLAPAHAFAVSPGSQWDGTRSGQVITYLLSVKNLGYMVDAFNLVAAPSTIGFSTSLWNSTFTALQSSTDPVAPGGTALVGVKVVINPLVANGVANTDLFVASSMANPSDSHSAQIKTVAVTDQILLIDDDGGAPNVQAFYQAALTAYGMPYNHVDLRADPALPFNYLKAHKVAVMFAGATYPGNLGQYDTNLANFLDGGGRLFLSGWDLLDQAGGTSPFVYDYLHVDWDGSETQNDKGTGSAMASLGNSITKGLGGLPYTSFQSIGLGSADFSDQLTLVAPAVTAFTDSSTGKTDGLVVQDGAYKVMFLAYPFEAINSTTSQAALMKRALDWFFDITTLTTNQVTSVYLPIILR